MEEDSEREITPGIGERRQTIWEKESRRSLKYHLSTRTLKKRKKGDGKERTKATSGPKSHKNPR